ncbi:MAG: hypothetical protein HY515_02875 [Candidatus Aenigmarchaeota archaeon]|nr:hypothetical protein [Candidatus Aenigmarchaeota archaeon]
MTVQLVRPVHKCGIGAAVNTRTPYHDMFGQAVSIQNRGYDGCGFSLLDESAHVIRTYKGEGKVTTVFQEYSVAEQVNSNRGIFNNRYKTTGDVNPRNLQPITAGGFVVSHNGNVFNYRRLAEEHGITLEKDDSDTHVIAQIIKQAGSFESGVRALAEGALGAFNLVAMDADGVVAAYRDPWGYHPLFAGRKGDSVYFASEEPGIYAVGIYDTEELKPGDLWLTDGKHTEKFSVRPPHTKSRVPIAERLCSFELPYFMRPGGSFNGILGSDFREAAGERLAMLDEFPNDGRHIVSPILNSGDHYAIGYSRGSGLPLRKAFIYNPDMTRIYMQWDKMTALGLTPQELAALKNMANPRIVKGKKVIVTDDSIVRASTIPKLVEELFAAGAEEVHVRIGTPPIISSCHMGLDHSDKTKLSAVRAVENPETAEIEEIQEKVRLSLNPAPTSLRYLPLQDFKELLGDRNNHCFACFTGKYPFPLTNGT